jgi:hypothetical protein
MDIMFEVSQGFKIPCNRQKFIDQEKNLDDFWAEANNYVKKQGCYVFAVRLAKGYNPWYVGKTKKTFKDECFTISNIHKYHKALLLEERGRIGNPVMFFVAPSGGKNVVRKNIVDELETFLIKSAKSANSKLINKRKVKLPDWGIKGVVRSGQGASSLEAKYFSRMMDI